MKTPINIIGKNFEAEVLNSNIPCLVDFWAPWCGPCKMIAPILDELAEEYDGKFKICKVNVDDHQDLSATYKIRSIPTLLIMKDGKIVETFVGLISKADLKKKLDNALIG